MSPFVRGRLQIALVLVAVLAYEAHALFVRRSGETAYLPPPAETQLSPEIAGPVTLEQTFVMQVDDLDAIRVFPHLANGSAIGTMQLALVGDTYTEPMARLSVPAADVAAEVPFTWTLPRIAQASGRTFTLRIAIPDATVGHGLRFEVGTPLYTRGELTIGARSFWGDLKFQTHAGRARLVTTLSDLRKQAPPLLRSDAVLVAGVAVFDWALVMLAVALLRAEPVADGG